MNSLEGKNYYELLGLTKEATKEQIKEAYKELARIYHPDSHYYDEILQAAGVNGTGEDPSFRIITDAYNTLSNDERRKLYDDTVVGTLPSWDEDQRGTWYTQVRVEKAEVRAETHTQPEAVGNFGHMNERQRSAFDEQNIRPMSEMIRIHRSWKWRFLHLLGFR